jgi:hypothetical protein
MKNQEKSIFRNALYANTAYPTYLVTEDVLGNRSVVIEKTFNTLPQPDTPSVLTAPSIR